MSPWRIFTLIGGTVLCIAAFGWFGGCGLLLLALHLIDHIQRR